MKIPLLADYSVISLPIPVSAPNCGLVRRVVQPTIALVLWQPATNTRYLVDEVAEYADRLAALLPDPLDTLMFVNSGSEANDLAYQIAGLLPETVV
jgi:4-aminobutyrate aminotransferase-like enzyme